MLGSYNKPFFLIKNKQIIHTCIMADSEIKLVRNILKVKMLFINTKQQISFQFLLNSFCLYPKIYGTFHS